MRFQAGLLAILFSFIASCGPKNRGDDERLVRENKDLKDQAGLSEENKKQAENKNSQLETSLADANAKATKADDIAKSAKVFADKAATDLAAANAKVLALRSDLNTAASAKDVAEKNAAEAKSAKESADVKLTEALNAKMLADKNLETARVAEENAKKENELNKASLISLQATLSTLTEQKAKLDEQIKQLNSSLGEDRKEKEGLKASLDKVKSSLDASLMGDPLSNLMADWTNNLAKIIGRIAELRNPPVAELRAALAKAGVNLPENPSQEELSAAVSALNAKVTESTAAVEGLQKTIKETEEARSKVASELNTAKTEAEKFQSLTVANTAATISPLRGLWMAEATDEVLPKDCLAFFLVAVQPNQIARAIICDNGDIETSTVQVDHVTTEPSRFSGALQFTTTTTPIDSSCKEGEGRIPTISSISFDLHTATGSEVSSYAFTDIGGNEVDLHSGAGLVDLNRTKDCSKIVRYATKAGDGASRILKAAARACQLEKQVTGCFTKENNFAPNTSTQPARPVAPAH